MKVCIMQEEILKCPKCSYQGIYFREKLPHYKCKKCGTEFNLEV
jgi:transposase-like protein